MVRAVQEWEILVTQTGKFEFIARMGFAARGILYFIIGFLALRAGRAEDSAGALDYLNGGTGKLLLGLMALGFVGYGLWRLCEAWLDTEGNGSDAKGALIRIGGVISGFIHLGLGYYAAKLSLGMNADKSAAGGTPEESAATLLALPGGTTLLLLVTVILLITGIFQLAKSLHLEFLRQLEPKAARQAWVRWAGRIGYGARGLVFLIIAFFFFRAARESTPEHAGGIAEAIQSLSPTVQTIVAIGFLAFGLFSFVEARYRRINDPKVIDRLMARARA